MNTNEEVLYSAPEEKKKLFEQEISNIGLFIEAMEQALKKQEQILGVLQTEKMLPEEEMTDRVDGVKKTIQSVLERIAKEKNKKNLIEKEVSRLEELHKMGIEILQNMKVNPNIKN